MGSIDFLRPEHGYALLVIVYANIMLAYKMMKVGGYRKKANIKYPAMYSDKDNVFNCYQRAHHNTLEWMPVFYSLFVPSALAYPVLASVLGFIFISSRFLYAWGYYTGNPKNRMWGAWGEIAVVVLLLMTAYIAVDLLGYV